MPDVQRTARVTVVTGTGTGIGKTHISEAILIALATRGHRTVGIKPVETGLTGEGISDAERLSRVSTFHVKHPVYAFPAPLSPHLAAREAGADAIRADVITDFIRGACTHADAAVVELAGGLFSPLADDLLNADIARALNPGCIVLIAPDRLGVLHDVFATLRAAATLPLPLDLVVLSAPETPDGSTGRNGAELRRFLPGTPVVELPRAGLAALATGPGVARIVDRIMQT